VLAVGAVLGSRFRVFVLFPVIGAVLVIALLACLVGGQAVSAVAIAAAIAVGCVQVGYFAGMLIAGDEYAEVERRPGYWKFIWHPMLVVWPRRLMDGGRKNGYLMRRLFDGRWQYRRLTEDEATASFNEKAW
jgi:hypothetical protein